jgi:DNA-binding PucR family transcriptional regulator
VSAAIGVDDLESIVSTVDSEWRELNDLPAIVEALATITGGSVAIEDVHSRVVAFSEAEHTDRMRTASILSHRLPEEWQRELRERGIYERLMHSEEVIRVEFDQPDLLPRRAMPIRLGRTTLGSIWLAGEDDSLAPDADEALRRTAPIAALQMMRQRLTIGVERRMRESAAAALLRGEDASPNVLGRVGLAADENLVVLAIAVLSRSNSSPAALAPRLIDLLTMHLRAYQRPAIATALDRSLAAEPSPSPVDGIGSTAECVYVLTSSTDDEDRDLLQRILGKGLEHAARGLGVTLHAGIGLPVGPAGDLVSARRSAEDCLRFGSRDTPVVRFEEVQDSALLADVDQFVDAWRGGNSKSYRALAEHDADHGTDYLATLACLLDSFGSASEVARRMHLHVNSARYRIRRISEITGVDFADGEARLALELTLRANLRSDRPDSRINP